MQWLAVRCRGGWAGAAGGSQLRALSNLSTWRGHGGSVVRWGCTWGLLSCVLHSPGPSASGNRFPSRPARANSTRWTVAVESR